MIAQLRSEARATTSGILCILAVVASARLNASPPEYYGVQITGRNVVFLLDNSGSMEDKPEGDTRQNAVRGAVGAISGEVRRRVGGKVGDILASQAEKQTTKMGAAQRELIRALGSLSDGTRFDIITFGANVTEWPGGFRPADATARRLAQAHVFAVSAKGDTPMREALARALTLPDVDTVFLVSDGRPTDASAAEILALVATKAGRIIVHTIGIGPDQDSDLMCAVAKQSGGIFVRDGEVACRPREVEPRSILNELRSLGVISRRPTYSKYEQTVLGVLFGALIKGLTGARAPWGPFLKMSGDTPVADRYTLAELEAARIEMETEFAAISASLKQAWGRDLVAWLNSVSYQSWEPTELASASVQKLNAEREKRTNIWNRRISEEDKYQQKARSELQELFDWKRASKR